MNDIKIIKINRSLLQRNIYYVDVELPSKRLRIKGMKWHPLKDKIYLPTFFTEKKLAFCPINFTDPEEYQAFFTAIRILLKLFPKDKIGHENCTPEELAELIKEKNNKPVINPKCSKSIKPTRKFSSPRTPYVPSQKHSFPPKKAWSPQRNDNPSSISFGGKKFNEVPLPKKEY